MRCFRQRPRRVSPLKTCHLNTRLLATCLLTALATLILAQPSYVLAQDKPQDKPTSASGSPQVAKAVGTIKSIQADSITVTESGGEVTARLLKSTKILRVLPGAKDLKDAATLQPQDLQPGDSVRIRGWAAADAHTIDALEVIVLKPADLAAKQQHDREDWQKRGVDGIVTHVDAATDIITIKPGAMGANRSIAIHVAKDTILRRYAPDSVKFEDAKPAPIDQIKTGDQLNARGSRSPEGSEVQAEEVVSGTFRYIEGTIKTIDSADNTMTVQDVIAKSSVVVRVSPDSQMWKLPPEMAQRIAIFLKGGAAGGSGDQSGANGQAQITRSGQGSAPGASGARPGTESQTGRGPSGGPGGNGPSNLQRMLSRSPSIKLADLQKGDAVVILTSASGKSDTVTASKLLAGVEAILTAAPSRSAASLLTPWALGAPGGEGEAAQ